MFKLHLMMAWLVTIASAVAASGRSPNVVIFYADDLGISDLGCYGCKDIKTPNIDALAASGVRFTNYYSAAPICSPSRAALMTGRYPIRCGMPNMANSMPGAEGGLPAEETTVAELAKTKGYATGIVGKWHLGMERPHLPNDQGFESFFGFRAGCIDYYSHMFYWQDPPHHDLFRNTTEIHLEGRYMTELISQEATWFVHEHKDRPFLLYVPFNAPHYAMQAPERHVKAYADLPPNRRIYAAMVAALDEAIGQIMQQLDGDHLTEDTLIFFASDNGATTELRANGGGGSNDPFRGFKFSLFDGGIHLPGIMSWRGHVPAGKIRDQLVGAIDVLPTIAEAIGAGLPADRTIDGRSLLPLARDPSAPGHDSMFWQEGHQTAVRRGQWKLVCNGVPRASPGRSDALKGDDTVLLSDLSVDPGESHNLRRDHPKIVESLQKLHAAWLKDVSGHSTTKPAR